MDSAYDDDSSPGLVEYFLILLLIGAVLTVALVTIGYSISHGQTKHGDIAIEVRNCFDSGNPTLTYKEGRSNRYLRFCDMGEEKIGLQILDKIGEAYEEKTAYIKTELHSLEEVKAYALKAGHTLLSGGLP